MRSATATLSTSRLRADEMPVRAVWNTPELVVDAPDPFAPPSPRIEKVGTPIELKVDSDIAALNARLLDTIGREAELADQGVGCRIKDAHGSSCHACPVYRDDDSPAAWLCAIGREQERLCTEILARRHGR